MTKVVVHGEYPSNAHYAGSCPLSLYDQQKVTVDLNKTPLLTH